MFIKGMTDFAHGAIAVVSHAVGHNRDATRAIAFKAGFLVGDRLVGTSATRSSFLNFVFGHIDSKGSINRQSQPWVGVGVIAALTGCNRDLPNHLGKHLAALSVLRFFAVLNIGPFTMPCHDPPRSIH
jgi:hypothetical protein